MADRGIIFAAPMVRALLAGRKTQTRRLMLKDLDPDDIEPPYIVPEWGRWVWWDGERAHWCTPNQVGDRLYVREAHRLTDCPCPEACRGPGHVWYEADSSGYEAVFRNRLRPSIHMPRWASRMTLPVSDVRVQRLQDISEADALAEGIYAHETDLGTLYSYGMAGDVVRSSTVTRPAAWEKPQQAYGALWDKLHTAPGERWNDNPWVVATTFSVEQRNIDAQSA